MSSLPFHTPCLYASVFLISSSAKNAHGHRRYPRVKTPTDCSGGESPEWDAPLRLCLPNAASPRDAAAAGKSKKVNGGGDTDTDIDVLLVKFEIKAEMAVLRDMHTASAAVPVPDLVADGRTRRVSYQLVGPDGRQPNGVISFSYAFHERNSEDDGLSNSGREPASPPCPAPDAVTMPPPTIAAAPRLYQAIDWTLPGQPPVYPPLTVRDKHFAIPDTQCYPPPPPAPPAEPTSVYSPAPPVEPASVYPPVTEASFCSAYPTVVEPASKASALYPTVDLAPVSYYPPATLCGVGFEYAAAPGWGDGDRCLHG